MEGKKTALYDEHVRLGGKIVNYAGWLLPVQYAGLIEEHNAVRQKLGVFDVFTWVKFGLQVRMHLIL